MNFEASHIDKLHFEHFSDVVCGQLMLMQVNTAPRILMRGPHQTYLRLRDGKPILSYHPNKQLGPFIQPSDHPNLDPIADWQRTSFKPPSDCPGDVYWITPDLWKTITFMLFG